MRLGFALPVLMFAIPAATAEPPPPPTSYTLHLSDPQLSYILQVLRSTPLRYQDVAPLLVEIDRQVMQQQPAVAAPKPAPNSSKK